jgi:hypothetical protein
MPSGPACSGGALADEREKESNQSDLTRFTYSMTVPASDLVQADAIRSTLLRPR